MENGNFWVVLIMFYAILLILSVFLLSLLMFVPRIRDYFLIKGGRVQICWIIALNLCAFLSIWMVLLIYETTVTSRISHATESPLDLFFDFLDGGGTPVIYKRTLDAINVTASDDSKTNVESEKSGGAQSESLVKKPSNHEYIFTVLLSLAGMFFLSSLLISTLSNMFNRRLAKINAGQVCYRFKHHTVFIGFDCSVPDLINQLYEQFEKRRSSKGGFIAKYKSILDNYRGANKFVILTGESPEHVRQELTSNLARKIEENVYIAHGRYDSLENLKMIYCKQARQIYVIGDDNNSDDSDSKNVSVLKNLSEIINEITYLSKTDSLQDVQKNQDENKNQTHTQPDVFLSVRRQASFALLQRPGAEEKIFKVHYKKNNKKGKNIQVYESNLPLAFTTLNFYQAWAQQVFAGNLFQDKNNKNMYKPLDYEQITQDSDKFVHLVVVGMSSMGIAMGIEAAILGNYANYSKGKKTRITFIDINGAREKNIFASRYDALYHGVNVINGLEETDIQPGVCNDFTWLELQFIEGGVEAPDIRAKLVEWSNDSNRLLTIAICLDDPASAMAAGMYLPGELFKEEHVTADNVAFKRWIPILINQKVSRFNQVMESGKDHNIYLFGMRDGAFDINFRDIRCAKLINYIYSIDVPQKETMSQEEINNYIERNFLDASESAFDKPWWEAGFIFRWSSRLFVDHIGTKLRMFENKNIYNLSWAEQIEFFSKQLTNQDNLDLISKVEHNRWVIEKLAEGFQRPSSEDLEKATPCPEDSKSVLDEKKKYKKCLEKKKFVHRCIVPYDNLCAIDKEQDPKMCSRIPQILNRCFSLEKPNPK